MEIVGTVAVILGFGFFLTWVLNSARKKQQDFVTALGCLDKKYGLVIYPGTLMKASNAVGSYDGLAIKVDTYTVDKSTFTRVTVEGDLPKEIFIQGEGMRTAFKKLFVGEDVQIGESRFDDEVYVKGDAVDILSYMNADARRAIGFAMAETTSLENGVLKVVTTGQVTDRNELERLVGLASQMGSALRRRERSQARRLVDIVRTDRNRLLRRKAFEALLERHSTLPILGTLADEIIAGSNQTINDDGSLIIAAAKFRGQSARSTVARLLTNYTQPFEVRAEAIKLLSRFTYDGDEFQPYLHAAFNDRAGPVLAAALQICQTRHIEVPGKTLDRLARHHDPHVRLAAARTSMVLLDPGTAERLMVLLKDPEDMVTIAAVKGLGEIGTTESIPALTEFAKSGFKTEVQDAIRHIQSRVTPGLSGGLAMTETDGDGQLSQVSPETEVPES